METTRHFTATTYVVNEGATALHTHERLGKVLPPGGHVDRDELPHEAAKREVHEEIGQEPTLVTDYPDISSDTSRTIPRPQHLLLADVNVHDGYVGHQHIDFVFYGWVESREINPADGEASPDAWDWYDYEALRTDDALDEDVVEFGMEAIATVEEHRSRKTA